MYKKGRHHFTSPINFSYKVSEEFSVGSKFVAWNIDFVRSQSHSSVYLLEIFNGLLRSKSFKVYTPFVGCYILT